jgi:hypothetical protein
LKRGSPGRRDDLARRLVPGNHALIAFRPLAQVLVIDGANIGAADGRRLHAQQNFSVAWLRHKGTVRISTVELPGKYAARIFVHCMAFISFILQLCALG